MDEDEADAPWEKERRERTERLLADPAELAEVVARLEAWAEVRENDPHDFEIRCIDLERAHVMLAVRMLRLVADTLGLQDRDISETLRRQAHQLREAARQNNVRRSSDLPLADLLEAAAERLPLH